MYIYKNVTDDDMKQLLRILVKALESFNDLALLEALIMALTRLQPLLYPTDDDMKQLLRILVKALESFNDLALLEALIMALTRLQPLLYPTDDDMKQLLRILVKALESFNDLALLEALIMALTRLQPLLYPTDDDMKQLLRILVKALESFNDLALLEALIMALTRLQPLLYPVCIYTRTRRHEAAAEDTSESAGVVQRPGFVGGSHHGADETTASAVPGMYIYKNVTDDDMKQLLRILVKALESFNDLALLEALIMALTRLQPLLYPVCIYTRTRRHEAAAEDTSESAGVVQRPGFVGGSHHGADETTASAVPGMYIYKNVTDDDMKQLLRILVKALESFNDLALLEALIMALTRLQPLLYPASPIHKALFWVALSVLQLDEPTLYAAGLAFMEQNLHTLESQGQFQHKTLEQVMMETREPLEWHFKQMDHAVGLSFRSNFHFALVGHLIKGYRHPAAATVSRTCRVLIKLLSLAASVATHRDKFHVTPDTVAYLTALVCVSEEVRSRCHVKHSLPKWLPDNCDHYCPTAEHHQSSILIQPSTSHSSCHSRRQKSWDVLDQVAISSAHGGKSPTLQSSSGGHSPHLVTIPHQDSEGRAHSMQHGATGESAREQGDGDSGFDMVEDDGRGSPGSTDDTERPPSTKSGDSDYPENSTKQASTDKDTSSPESNSLLDPSVLSDFTTQALVLTVLATLVKYTTDEDEIRILYQYLAEGSVVFPKVFPVIHSLLDMKINHVLMHCHDQLILSAVQSIIQNMIASEDASQQQLHYMQSCGFGGLWRFAGPFTKNQCTAESSELFVNCLEAMVETCLPGGDEALTRAPPPDPDHPDPLDQHRYPGVHRQATLYCPTQDT
ncbi:hypothetical protein PYW07_011360 [Mythimna separata]|uniref:Neurofibromin n=1 Tax=Mythimna separata TaxID=271217 RepID=A0AAD8DLE8_MYTSE|nr:hypothetical protein PYW07_011360 [Mythimna separata]